MIGPTSPRVTFAGELQNLHRELALDYLRARGADVPEWDIPAITEQVHDKQIAVGGLIMAAYDGNLFPTVEPIFGNKAFVPFISRTPADYCKTHLPIDWEATPEQHLIRQLNTIDAPVKVVDLFLHPSMELRKRPSNGVAFVFAIPDSPPFALDVSSAHEVTDYSETKPSDSELIQPLVELFGQEAKHYLSDDECSMVVTALRSSNPRLGIDTGSSIK